MIRDHLESRVRTPGLRRNVRRSTPWTRESQPTWLSRGLIAGLALVAVACERPATGGPPTGGGGPPAIPVQIVTVSATNLPIRIPAVGSLRSRETTTVAADISGIIVGLDTPEGRQVKVGRVLARLDDAKARAALAVARARHENATAELERVTPLFEQGVVSRSAYDAAVAEMATADGLLEEAETALTKTEVRAPFTGVLGIQTAQLGQFVSSGDPIVQISQIDPLELIFSLPERYAADVRTGQMALGMVGACGPRFDAVVDAIDPSVDPGTRTLSLQAAVPNPDAVLRPGMSARVRLVVGEEPDAVIVPQEAIVRQGTKYLVWVVGDDTTAHQREVVLGEFLVDGVQVRAGLEPGEQVIAAGFQKLRPGMPTMAMPFVPTENPNLNLGRSTDDIDCYF